MTIKLLTDWPYALPGSAGFVTMPAGAVVGVFDAATEAGMIAAKLAIASAAVADWLPPSRAGYPTPEQALVSGPSQIAAAAGLPALTPATDILRSGIPFIKAPSGSVAANGAITLGTALAVSYPDGCYMYLPGGVAFGGAVAGWYYVTMSSTTVGVIFNNRYITGNPSIPASPTPIVAAGPGAFTGTNSLILAQNTTLLGNSMGANGALTIAVLAQCSATAGGKIYNGSVGGTLAGGLYVENDTRPISHLLNIRNRGKNNSQIFHDSFAGDYGGYLNGAMGRLTLDMGLTQVVGATMSVGSVDWLCLEAITITNFPMA